MNGDEKLSRLFWSLQPGDLLLIPVKYTRESRIELLYSAVLYLGKEGELYISCPRENEPVSKLYCYGPIHWDDEEGSFVDPEGNVIMWSSPQIQVERGVAVSIVEEYQNTLREWRGSRFSVTDDDIESFKKGPLPNIISDIVRSGEPGDLSQRMSLVMDYLGVEHSMAQLLGLSFFFQFMQTVNSVRETTDAAVARSRTEEVPPDQSKRNKLH